MRSLKVIVGMRPIAGGTEHLKASVQCRSVKQRKIMPWKAEKCNTRDKKPSTLFTVGDMVLVWRPAYSEKTHSYKSIRDRFPFMPTVEPDVCYETDPDSNPKLAFLSGGWSRLFMEISSGEARRQSDALFRSHIEEMWKKKKETG